MGVLPFFAWGLLFLLGCSSGPPLPQSWAPTTPELGNSQKKVTTLVLMTFNDLHGALRPREDVTEDAEPQTVSVGGASLLASHARFLRDQFKDSLLILDAGDAWSGSLESDLLDGAPVVEFFNNLEITASTLGGHDFSFAPKYPDPLRVLRDRLSQSRYPVISSNLIDTNSKKPLALLGLTTTKVVQANGVKVGILAVTSPAALKSVWAEAKKHLEFGRMRETILRSVESLKKEGADVIVLLAHVPLRCEERFSLDPMTTWRPTKGPSRCQGELAELLESLPNGLIDAVVSGGSHSIVHHWIGGTPVVQSGGYGRFYHLIYLPFDTEKRTRLTAQYRIEGPVTLCERVFSNQGNCNVHEPPPETGRGTLTRARFKGRIMEPSRDTDYTLNRALRATAAERGEILAEATRPVFHSSLRESEMGNLVADALKRETGADFAMINPGFIQDGLRSGNVTLEALYRALPYDDRVVVLELKGSELRDILEIAFCGARGVFSIAGLQVKVVPFQTKGKVTDLNRDGTISHWEVRRLLDVRDEKTGKAIIPGRSYTLATSEFLAGGGDDLAWATSRIPDYRVQTDPQGKRVRDLVRTHLRGLRTLNMPEMALFRPERPRVSFGRGGRATTNPVKLSQ